MVSKKTVIILFVIAIVLVVVSVVVSISVDDSKLMDETGSLENQVIEPDSGSAMIGVEIIPPAIPLESE